MNENDLLRKYYDEHVRSDFMRSFDQLTDVEKDQVRGMFGFALFKAGHALQEAKQAVANKLSKN